MRIQKYLSEQNMMSRRKGEALIREGMILLNGKVAQLGDHINPETDHLDFVKPLSELIDPLQTIAFYKPQGVVTNCPQGDEVEIVALLPDHLKHLSAIGRLDKESEGLILLTNDGVLSKLCLSHEKPHHRVYQVWAHRHLNQAQKQRLEKGVLLDGQKTLPLSMSYGDQGAILVDMVEGKNRQIRRMFKKVGLEVLRLKRIQFGDIDLAELEPGQYYFLSDDELASLKRF